MALKMVQSQSNFGIKNRKNFTSESIVGLENFGVSIQRLALICLEIN
jgi:hypothetical protein